MFLLNTTGRDRKPCPFPVVKFHLFILGVVVIHDLVVGIVILAALVTLGAALLAGLGGVALGRLLLIQLLAHLVEQLGQLLGGGLDGVGVLALQGLLQLVNTGLDGAFSLSGSLSPTSLRVFSD